MKNKFTSLFVAVAMIGAFLFSGCVVRTEGHEGRQHSRHYYERRHMEQPQGHSELRVDVRP